MWIYWNELIQAPQLWDVLARAPEPLTSAVWFPLLAKGAPSTYGIYPKPIHNPDGTETMWCWSKPESLYEELLAEFGHFPLHHFWGPLASIKGSEWITETALWFFERKRPNFMYIYVPHLDYQAQKWGPDAPQSMEALKELDQLLEKVFDRFRALADDLEIIVAGEYAITPVSRPIYPNIALREAGFLAVKPEEGGGEVLDTGRSRAWALVDHQVAHVYVNDPSAFEAVADLCREMEGVERVLAGDERRELEIDPPRAGDIILVAEPDKWFAYPWWTDEAAAPAFARRVDIHRKPGYDPVELFMDPATGKIPLDASLIKGSHGRTGDPKTNTVLLRSQNRPLPARLHQRDVYHVLLEALGVKSA